MATPSRQEEPSGLPRTRAEVLELVRAILVEQLGINAKAATEEASFMDNLDADSLDLVELIMELEDSTGIKISDEDVQKLTTVGETVDYICQALGITQ